MNKPNLNTQSVLSMKGEGYYSQKTVGAKNAIDKMEVLIEEAFKNKPIKPSFTPYFFSKSSLYFSLNFFTSNKSTSLKVVNEAVWA